MEEELTPFGFMDVGLDLEFTDDEGTTWKVIDENDGSLMSAFDR